MQNIKKVKLEHYIDLVEACKTGDIGTVQHFVETREDDMFIWKIVSRKLGGLIEDEFLHWSRSPLHCASAFGHIEIVKYLISKGFNPSINVFNGHTSLSCSCKFGKIEIVRYLIENGVDTRFSYLITCKYGHIDILKYLESVDVNLKKELRYGKNALHYACKGTQLEIVKFLVEKGIDVNEMDHRMKLPIHYACRKGGFEIVKYLINSIEKDKSLLYRGLTIAANKGAFDIVKYFVEIHNTPLEKDDPFISPIVKTVEKGHYEIFEYLKNHGSDIKKELGNGSNLLFLAVYYGHLKLVRFLLSQGLRTSTDYGDTILHTCSKQGHIEIMKFLLENQNDIDKLSFEGYNALDYSAMESRKEIVKMLIDKGAIMSDTILTWMSIEDGEIFKILIKNNFFPYKIFSCKSMEAVDCKHILKINFHKYRKVPAHGLLLIAREKDNNSLFHKDFLPLDIFKEIYTLVGKVCREHEWEMLGGE